VGWGRRYERPRWRATPERRTFEARIDVPTPSNTSREAVVASNRKGKKGATKVKSLKARKLASGKASQVKGGRMKLDPTRPAEPVNT